MKVIMEKWEEHLRETWTSTVYMNTYTTGIPEGEGQQPEQKKMPKEMVAEKKPNLMKIKFWV